MPLSYQKSTYFISFLFFQILSAKYLIVECMENSISVDMTSNDLEYLIK